MSGVPPTRVLIVEDDGIVRSGLRLMLGGHDDLDVIGDAADGRQAVELFDALGADVVLMDIRMPRMDGLEATRALMTRPRPPRVIVLTTFDADAYILDALTAGASGFLLKDTPPPEIVAAVRKVAAGDAMLSPAVIGKLLARFREGGAHLRSRDAQQRLATLTDRERDIARAIGRGLANTEIAAALHLSVTTVKGHITHLFEKLDVSNRVQVAICVHDAERS